MFVLKYAHVSIVDLFKNVLGHKNPRNFKQDLLNRPRASHKFNLCARADPEASNLRGKGRARARTHVEFGGPRGLFIRSCWKFLKGNNVGVA